MPSLSRGETIARFRDDMHRLLAAVAALSPTERAEPIWKAWSVREVLVHIAAWDRALAPAIDALLAGRRPPFAGDREAAFNARAVRAGRGVPFHSVLAETRAAHRALLARMRKLTGEEWRRPGGPGSRTTVASLFAYTYRSQTHYGGHAAEIDAWRLR